MTKKIIFLAILLLGTIAQIKVHGKLIPLLHPNSLTTEKSAKNSEEEYQDQESPPNNSQECNHTINLVNDFYACDEDGNSFEEFNIDLDELKTRLIGSQTGLTVTYHDPAGNLIDFSLGTQFVVNQRRILVRATDANGCIRETSFNLFVQPPPNVPILNDVLECETYVLPELPAGSHFFTGISGGGTMLLPGEVITNTRLIYIYANVGLCTSQSSFKVTIDKTLCPMNAEELPPMKFPSFFTPNEDGINDYWHFIPPAETNDARIIYIQIFNRYGLLLKQLDSKSQGWDGTFMGSPMPPSDYWFRAIDNFNNVFTGHFTLKR